MKNKFYSATIVAIFLTTFLMAGVIISPQQVLAASGNQLIQWGSSGQKVSIFASDLTKLGFNKYGTDSIFGINNYNAVFSSEKATGIVGPMTNKVVAGKKSGGITYQVQWGDSLYKLARKFGIAWGDIMMANNLSRHTIYVGETLVIPTNTSVTKYTVPDKPDPDNNDDANSSECDCSEKALSSQKN